MLNRLLQPEVQAFIKEHQKSDLNRLLLNKRKYPHIPMDLVVDQIRAIEKAKLKLPLWAETPGVVMPPLLSMEQCSSEQAAEYKASLFQGHTCIDLTGGAGVDTFYLSKQFQEVHYVEQNPALAEIAQHNFKLLGANNIIVHNTRAENFLAGFKAKADLVYIDPARRENQAKVFRFESCSPNIIPLQETLLSHTKYVLVKASPMLDITLGARQLKDVNEVHVVAFKNEVKELLFLQSDPKKYSPLVKAVDLASPYPFEFVLDDLVGSSLGPIQKYLYEPNAPILKSGGQNALCERFPIIKLNENTHLFTSNSFIDTFPGRSFEVKHVVKYTKKEILKALKGSKANIAVRNFPDTVDVFRKKTMLKNGGDVYIFGYKNHQNNLEVAICEKPF